MGYIITIIIIISSTAFLTLYRKFHNVRDKNQMFFGFVLNIISTFIGLFLALYFNDSEAAKADKNKTIQILSAMESDVNTILTSQFPIYFDQYDSTNRTKDLHKLLCEYPAKEPKIFRRYLVNEQIIRNVNSSTYSFLLMEDDLISNHLFKVNSLCDSDWTNQQTRREIGIYFRQIELVQKALRFEIDNIKTDKSNEEILKAIQKQKFFIDGPSILDNRKYQE